MNPVAVDPAKTEYSCFAGKPAATPWSWACDPGLVCGLWQEAAAVRRERPGVRSRVADAGPAPGKQAAASSRAAAALKMGFSWSVRRSFHLNDL